MVLGGAGQDNLRGDAGNDTLDGGDGIDLVTYRFDDIGAGLTINFSTFAGTGTLNDLRGGVDNLYDIEQLLSLGTDFNDRLEGSLTLADYLQGSGGDDRVIGGNASDLSLDGGAGNDTVEGFGGDDIMSGGDGNDGVWGGAGNDTMSGGAGNDTMRGDGGDDTIDGGEGYDTLMYSFQLTPGPVTLDFRRLVDGAGTVTLGAAGTDTVSNFEAMNISMTTANDTVFGAAGVVSYIAGLGGDDRLYGNTANDVLDGGDGNDRLDGREGIDRANYASAAVGVTVSLATTRAQDTVGAGIDTPIGIEHLLGSRFDDRLTGDALDNALLGIDGNDVIVGGAGIDVIRGDEGFDIAVYGAAAGASFLALNFSSLVAGAGSLRDGQGGTDQLSGIERLMVYGTAGDDVVRGANGVQLTVVAGDRNNQLTGGSVADLFYQGRGNDVIDGGAGPDGVDYQFTGGDVVVDLNLTTAQNTGSGSDTLTGIENLFGSAFADTFTGNAAANRLTGAGGNDRLIGNGGNDILQGDAGQDDLSGGAGNDRLLGGTSTDVLDGGSGNDVLIGGGSADELKGGTGADVFFYELLTDSGKTAGASDKIVDFSQSQGDRIDLSAIDAVAGTDANDAFRFIGDAAFSGVAGELHVASEGTGTVIQVDVNGDKAIDMMITLTTPVALTAGDFLL